MNVFYLSLYQCIKTNPCAINEIGLINLFVQKFHILKKSLIIWPVLYIYTRFFERKRKRHFRATFPVYRNFNLVSPEELRRIIYDFRVQINFSGELNIYVYFDIYIHIYIYFDDLLKKCLCKKIL